MRLSRLLVGAALLVGVGRLLSPDAVPVYDGIGAPDEPYRYVAAPAGATKTADATTARATSPLVKGKSTYGMSLATKEVGPQFSLFVPPMAFAAAGSSVVVTAAPEAPVDQPPGATIDGNVYTVSVKAGGPVTLTPQAALATLYLRSTTAKQPGPIMQYRAPGATGWTAIKTSRGGQDIYVSAFPGPGSYALAFAHRSVSSGGSSPMPYVVIGGVLVLVAVVVVVRVRAKP